MTRTSSKYETEVLNDRLKDWFKGFGRKEHRIGIATGDQLTDRLLPDENAAAPLLNRFAARHLTCIMFRPETREEDTECSVETKRRNRKSNV